MARAKFTAPQSHAVNDAAGPEVPSGSPPVVEPCTYLREIASGRIYPYTELMARRGDLVEAYEGPVPSEQDEVAMAMAARGLAQGRRDTTQAGAPQAPLPPTPPQPPKAQRTRRTKAEMERDRAAAADPLGPIIGVEHHEAEVAAA